MKNKYFKYTIVSLFFVLNLLYILKVTLHFLFLQSFFDSYGVLVSSIEELPAEKVQNFVNLIPSYKYNIYLFYKFLSSIEMVLLIGSIQTLIICCFILVDKWKKIIILFLSIISVLLFVFEIKCYYN